MTDFVLKITDCEDNWTLKAHLLGTGRKPGQVKQHWVYMQAGRLKLSGGIDQEDEDVVWKHVAQKEVAVLLKVRYFLGSNR